MLFLASRSRVCHSRDRPAGPPNMMWKLLARIIWIALSGFFFAVAYSAPESDQRSLVDAIERGDVETFERLIGAVSDVNSIDERGRSLLLVAVDRGDLNAIWTLLLRGADPNLADRAGRTPLLVAAERGDATITQALLILSLIHI